MIDTAVDLLLHPARYFERLLNKADPTMPWPVIWTCGMAGVLSRIDFNLLMGPVTTEAPHLTSWAALWGVLLFGGGIMGTLSWLLGGWWYRIRMNLSGARGVNKRSARLVYMHANLVWSVPSLIWLVLVTPLYSDYYAVFADSPLWYALVLTGPWASWVSYCGVRRCFDVRPGRARAWFLIVPLTFYAAIFVAVLILSWFGPL